MSENKYNALTPSDIGFFESIVGSDNFLSASEKMLPYSSDSTEDFVFVPEAVLFPSNAEEVSQIAKHCNTRNIPLTVRGAGTGLSGGSLPVEGGIVLATSKLNQILAIDEKNFQATVEPGVITQEFKNAVAAKGLFYPPDPASMGSCYLGGNLAENSGGPKAIKYGVTSDYVLNLEVVLANGDIIWTGANVLKNATGYNLTQLMVGSEGTLGIITKVQLKLLPLPKQDLLMLAYFDSLELPCNAVSAILNAGICPSAIEFMERSALEWSMKFADVSIDIQESTKAILLIEVDGMSKENLLSDCEKIHEILESLGCTEVLFAEDRAEKDRLWKVRRVCGEAVHAHSVYKEEDTVVPRYELAKLLARVKEIGANYGFQSVCYGHAGDGNLHINILKGTLTDEAWNHTIKAGIREIFQVCHELGGTISGEHGIGYVQKEYLDIVFSKNQIELMKGIKSVFDPNGILNPNKIFPSE